MPLVSRSFVAMSISAQSISASLRQLSRSCRSSSRSFLDLSEHQPEARQLSFSRRQLGR
jgi:hypothetical protein